MKKLLPYPVLPTLIPLAAFLCGLLCGIRQGARPGIAVWATVLFLPTVLPHDNSSDLVYAPVYEVIAPVGNVVGSMFRKKR